MKPSAVRVGWCVVFLLGTAAASGATKPEAAAGPRGTTTHQPIRTAECPGNPAHGEERLTWRCATQRKAQRMNAGHIMALGYAERLPPSNPTKPISGERDHRLNVEKCLASCHARDICSGSHVPLKICHTERIGIMQVLGHPCVVSQPYVIRVG